MTRNHDNARVFMAFSDVTRLRVLELLRQGENSATVLQRKIGAGQSTLSHHMRVLVESGIVSSRKAGKWTFYSLCESGGRYAARLLKHLTTVNKVVAPPVPTTDFIVKRRAGIVKPFTIVIDTSSDLSAEFIEENGLEVIPIPFILDGVEHSRGYWQEISGVDFYNALRNGGIARTSQINPDSFLKAYAGYIEKGEDVLLIILSSALSATYQSSMIAHAEIKEKFPDCGIFPVDSLGATSLNSLLIKLAIKKRDEGWSAEETAAWLDEKKHNILGMVTVDDLMYLHRGGRLSKLSAVGGSLLGIKPIVIILPDGSLALKEKVRGRDAALRLMVNNMMRSIDPEPWLDSVHISHTDCEKDAQKLAEMVRASVNVRNIDVSIMGPVVGAHVGPGSVTLVYMGNVTREEYDNKIYG